jgi:aminoglycoside phosphotransferase (APT) family kinase protein
LHALPVSDFVDRVERAGFSSETFTFDSYFANIRASAEDLGLNELRPAIDWLLVNRACGSPNPVVCHGDFQPLNILADYGRLSGVIDWVKATIAEPAFDYGAVLAILATADSRPRRIASNVAGTNEQSNAHTFAALSIFAGERGRASLLPDI